MARTTNKAPTGRPTVPQSRAAFGLVSRAAARLLQKEDRERSGVVSSAQNHTHFLDSPRIRHVLTESTFSLRALVAEASTCYLILPPSHLRTYRRWVRLMIGGSLQALTQLRGAPRERVLFLLDEFAHLGRLRPVEDGISLASGYGAAFWVIVQDLAQLRHEYPDSWEHFLASADVLQAFGVNDYETAEHLSKLTGEATVMVESENFSAGVARGRSEARQEGQGRTLSERGRRLMTPDEVRRLAPDRELVFIKGTRPLNLRRLNYLTDREFVGRFDANPLHIARNIP